MQMDIKLNCIICGKNFTFTEGEQSFYLDKRLSPPKRCKKCRGNIKELEKTIKTSSFFENAQVFGMPESVEGGLYYEQKYYVEIIGKGYMFIKGEKIFISKTPVKIDSKEVAERLKTIAEKHGDTAKVCAKSCWEHFR